MIPNAHNLPRILSVLLVTEFSSFLIIFVLNIYLFLKILCHLKDSVFILHIYFLIHFQMISNFLNIN